MNNSVIHRLITILEEDKSMLTATIEIPDLPLFYRDLDDRAKIRPVLEIETKAPFRFRLILETGETSLTVTKHSKPVLFGSVNAAIPILKEGYVRGLVDETMRLNLHGHL